MSRYYGTADHVVDLDQVMELEVSGSGSHWSVSARFVGSDGYTALPTTDGNAYSTQAFAEAELARIVGPVIVPGAES